MATKVKFELPEGWEANILELYEQGASDVEIKALIIGWRGSFSNGLWTRWINEVPIFSKTIKRGRLLCQKWWEVEGRMSLNSKDFNATLWYMNMKNRFGWKDRAELDHLSKGKPIKQLPAPAFYITEPMSANGNGTAN